MSAGLFFESPHFLFLLLVPVPAVAVQLFRWRTCSPPLHSFAGAKKAGTVRTFFFLRMMCGFFAWCFAVFALADPFAGRELQAVKKQGCAIAFVFDISRSMLVADTGGTRLAAAAEFAQRIQNSVDGCSCSAVLVKGGAYLAIPLTRDRMSFAALLPALDPALLSEPGTNLAAGLECAAQSFPPSGSSAAYILYFTDGESLSGDLTAAAAGIRQSGITVIFAGTGTRAGGAVPQDSRGGDPVYSRLNEKALQSAAAVCGGMYVDTGSAGAEAAVVSLLKSAASSPQIVYTEHPRSCRTYALVVSILLCAAAVCSVPGKKRGYRHG